MNALAESPHAAIAERASSEAWRQVNAIDRALAQMPQVEMPLTHTFTPGLYARTIFMPAGAIITSRIHLFEHPFVLAAGALLVWDDEQGVVELRAPHVGVTKPGTRRVLRILEDAHFTSFHVTEGTDPEQLVDILTEDPVKLGHLDDLDPQQLEALRRHSKPCLT